MSSRSGLATSDSSNPKGSSAMSSVVPGNWSRLPGDVWYMIGLRLDSATDRIRFRAVSKSLRSNLPYRQPPWLLLSEFNENPDRDDDSSEEEDDVLDYQEEEEEEEEEEDPTPPAPPQRRFVILGEQSFYKINLPQTHLSRCVGSTNDWVVIVKLDITIHLLNPFTNIEFRLPDGLTFGDPYYKGNPLPPYNEIWRDSFLRKVILYPPPCSSSDGTDIFVIAVQKFGMLAMCRPCDSSWTNFKIDTTKYDLGVRDIIVYKGILYAITYTGMLLSSDFLSSYPKQPPELYGVHTFDIFKVHKEFQLLYLVECCGDLLLVIKSVNIYLRGKDHLGRPITTPLPFYKTEKFQIYKFDFTSKSWIEIKSLGEYSLFLGFNTSVSVLASDYYGLVKKNCIYFTDDFFYGYCGTSTPGGFDMGVFNLDDNSITPHYKTTITCYYSPSLWIVPD